ncbi:MAG: RHS repeat-associated core domain-containing protein [Vulcanimicrobiota bacterium]
MTLRTDAATSDTIAYRWDDQDNLIRVAFSPADTKVLHTYDAGGIRKAKILDDETVTESFYSGLPTLNEVETPAVGSPVEFNYLMGHQLMGFESGGDFFYLLTDGLTSVRIVVDGSGDEVAAYEYLEFGEQTKTGSGSSPKTFVGGLGVHDDSGDTNLLYMRARHYDARLGRFLSRDPIGFAGGLNLYGYVGGNPVNYVDPVGLDGLPGADTIRPNGFSPSYAETIQRGIAKIRALGYEKEADVLASRWKWDRLNRMPGNPHADGFTNPFTRNIGISESNCSRSADEAEFVYTTALLFHEARHVLRQGTLDSLWFGIVGHWLGDPRGISALETPVWEDESRFLESWSARETDMALIPHINTLNRSVDKRILQQMHNVAKYMEGR